MPRSLFLPLLWSKRDAVCGERHARALCVHASGCLCVCVCVCAYERVRARVVSFVPPSRTALRKQSTMCSRITTLLYTLEYYTTTLCVYGCNVGSAAVPACATQLTFLVPRLHCTHDQQGGWEEGDLVAMTGA